VSVGCLLFCGCGKEDSRQKNNMNLASFYINEDGVLGCGTTASSSSFSIGTPCSTYSQDTGLRISLTPLKMDENSILMTPESEWKDFVFPAKPQCGIYEISIFEYGEPVFYSNNFRYSGEDFVEIARGSGWEAVITREDLNKEAREERDKK